MNAVVFPVPPLQKQNSRDLMLGKEIIYRPMGSEHVASDKNQ